MMLMSNTPGRNIFFIVACLILIGGAVFMVMSQSPEKEINDGSDIDVNEPPQEVTMSGETVCLPHKDTDGPQTMECAFGLKADNGNHYALNMTQVQNGGMIGFDTGMRMTVTGLLVPIEQISTDMWNKYDIKGIVSVTSVEQE
jgi:hypothetical protein